MFDICFFVLYVMIAPKTMGFAALGREAFVQNELQKGIRSWGRWFVVGQANFDELRRIDSQVTHGGVRKIAVDLIADGIPKPGAHHGVGGLDIHGGKLHIGADASVLEEADAVDILAGAGLDIGLWQKSLQGYRTVGGQRAVCRDNS